MKKQWALIFFALLAYTCLIAAILVAPAFLALPWLGEEEPDTVYLLYASAGSMPQLLNTRQIDAFLAWEPVVSNAELSGIGKRIAVPSDLPPPGRWNNTAINVLVLHQDTIDRYPEVSSLLSALTTAAIDRIPEDPDQAKEITADWVFGKELILTPEGTLAPLDLENLSFENMVFTSGARPSESPLILQMADPADKRADALWWGKSRRIAEQGSRYLSGSEIPKVQETIPALKIGYIPSSDNYAPLYVMVRDSGYFCERYGFCLVPDDENATRPVKCTLFVQGAPVAKIQLVPGQSGGGIMTTIGQGALDGAYVGSYPAELQIVDGNPSCIIQSINTGGSGLVVDPGAPCSDWDGFVRWIKVRAAEGDPVVLATIQSSIQEDMVREACEYENLTVRFYGTGFQAYNS